MATRKYDINDFNARVKKINNPRNKSYYDPDLGMHIPKRVTRDKIEKPAEPSFLGKFVVSMIVGALALLIAQIIRIRYFGLLEQSDVVFYLELFIALWAMLLLSALMDRRKAVERIAQFAGIAVMLTAGHNLIWRCPEPMAVIYTADYVEQIMHVTTQHSIVYRGSIFAL